MTSTAKTKDRPAIALDTVYMEKLKQLRIKKCIYVRDIIENNCMHARYAQLN